MKIQILKKAAALITILSTLVIPIQTQAGLNDVFKGWGWTPNIGWISMNSTNTIAETNPANSYGVTVDETGNVTGWAWSQNLGWICFGTTCSTYGMAPGGETSWAQFDGLATDPQIHGWARIKAQYDAAPSTDAGWISLNCASLGGHVARNVCNTTGFYNVHIETSTGLLRGYGWNCTSSDGLPCTSGNYTGGVGWIRFDADYTPPPGEPPGTFGGVPWVQVLYGDIYAKGSIQTPSPFTQQFGQVNATYCIDTGAGTGQVTHFTQGPGCAKGMTNTNINVPKYSSYYSNTLGRIRLRGYDTRLIPSDTVGLAAGKYGPWMQITNIATQLPNLSVLGGKIYDTCGSTTCSYGDWHIPARVFNNAASGSGAGLVIIRGNLYIDGDIAYGGGTITSLQQLASLGILVLDDGSGTMGNIYIDSSVETVSANIYAEGVVTTGTNGDPTTEVALEINGVAVARQFNFQRVFPGNVTTPAEMITYDGRIVANTPPGLSDFAGSLPAVSY
jgi:hypothetical protein